MISTNRAKIKLIILGGFLLGISYYAHSAPKAGKVQPPAPLYPIPTERQLTWHELGQYAFIHFTTNTFTGKEWGYGDEDPAIFNPSNLDVNQWVKVIQAAGLKGIVLTCKHHDGFCLWPSGYTDHSVRQSPWKEGKGDVVKLVADACHQSGLKFGVYLSPWDRNRADYGTPSYITYYRNQLKELFSTYGPIFEMWFDGANGGDGFYGGAREKRKIDASKFYDWPNTLKMVRSMEPEVIFFSDAGPDIRWCGNEQGYAGETNWAKICTDSIFPGKHGIEHYLNSGQSDGLAYVPSEVDVSIRPGWFYHKEQDDQVKTPEQLFDIYLNSVGRGSNLILNIPPDRRGLLHERDVQSLLGWKKLRDEAFKTNLARKAPVEADSYRGNDNRYAPAMVTDGNKESYWSTDDRITTGSLTINLGAEHLVKYVLLQEYIRLGQRIEGVKISAWKGNQWVEIANATTIGFKRILKVDPLMTQRIKIDITASKAAPVISNIEVY